MCFLCELGMNPLDTNGPHHANSGERSAESVSYDTNTNDSDQSTDALISGSKWSNTDTIPLTFSFTDSASDYTDNQFGTFLNAFDATQQQAVRDAFDIFASISNLSFSEQAFGSADATLRFAEFSGVSTAYGYYPSSSESGGDMAFNPTNFNTPTLGSYAFATVLHEIGHALGLKHGHDTTGPGSMRSFEDGMEYSVMTYNSFVGQNTTPGFYTNSSGHYAQTLMMYDIAAIQRMYGADFTSNATNTTYTFSTTTGEMFINGVSQGTPDANVIFRTVWDGDGIDTYDLSNYTTNLRIDLDPGDYSNFDVGGNDQRARLNAGWDSTGTFVGAAEYEYASGHLYNALQYDGDLRSLIENAITGDGNDTIDGNDANNTLTANGGLDFIYAGSGNDTAYGGDGNDYLYGGTDDDALYGGNNDDRMYGSTGEDDLYGGAGNDTMYGGSNDDYFRDVDAGANSFYGGSGFDFLSVSGQSDAMYINLATNSVSGGSLADDLISGFEGIYLGNGDDTAYGTTGINTIYGGSGNDTMFAGGDADYLSGGAGQDSLYGGDGADTMYGSTDNDSLYGGSGDDTMYGGTGADYFRAGDGAQSFYGGDDKDYISYYDSTDGININLDASTVSGGWGDNDVIDGFESVGGSKDGADKMYGTSGSNTFKGYGGSDSFYGGSGTDRIYGGSGNDYVRVGGGTESFYGGSGKDYISYYDSTGGITIDLDANTVTGSWANNDVIDGFESVGGSKTGGDKMYGTSGSNTFKGYGGNDSFYGGSGTDRVYGGDGNDYVRVGGGTESFYGGDGKDYISYYDSTGGITIDLDANTITGSWGSNDVISGFESFGGSKTGDDKVYGTSGANTIKTYGGKDSVYAGSGADKVYLGDGNDYVRAGGGTESFYGGDGKDYISYYDSTGGITIDLEANSVSGSWASNDVISGFESVGGSNAGNDKVYGTSGSNTVKSYGGNDSIWGRSGDDKLYGGSGEDRFDGGNGDDTLWGGSGADTFHFDHGEDNDIIKDFENNIDTIQLDNFGYADAAEALTYATEVGGDVIFDFGGGDTLTVENTSKAALLNDLEIV